MGQWTTFHPAVFLLTFVSYALYHMVRKTPSYVQTSLLREWTPPSPQQQHPTPVDATPQQRPSLFQDQQSAQTFVGVLNAVFLFVYAAGNLFSGVLAERLDHRMFLTAGMTLSALVMFVFGPVLEWTDSRSQGAYLTLQVLSALCQSTGWPCLVPVMASWFDKRSRGYLLGLWSSSASVGGILGALLVSEVVGYGYEYAFVLTSAMLLAGAVLIFFGLVASPDEVGVVSQADAHKPHNKEKDDDQSDGDEKDNDHGDYYLNRETQALLEKRTSLHKTCGAHASYSSCDMTHSNEVSLTTRKASDSKLTVCGTATSHQDHKSKLSAWDSLRNAQTSSSLLPASSDSAAQPDSSSVLPGEKVLQSEWNGNLIPDSEQQRGSESTTGSNEHISTMLTESHFHSVTNCINHTNELFQTEISKDTDPSTSPKNSVGPQQTDVETSVEAVTTTSRNSEARPAVIGFYRALLLPGILSYCCCFFFLKLVVYVFFFWLPFYLASAYGWSESAADRLSLWFDLGGIFGASASSLLMSRLNKTGLVMSAVMVLSVPVLYLYGVKRVGQNTSTNALMLFCLGALLQGVSSHLSAAVSADLSQRRAVTRGVRVISTVTGILEGCGTVGAAVGQVAVPYLYGSQGWNMVYWVLMGAVGVSILSLIPVMLVEVRELRNTKQRQHSDLDTAT